MANAVRVDDVKANSKGEIGVYSSLDTHLGASMVQILSSKGKKATGPSEDLLKRSKEAYEKAIQNLENEIQPNTKKSINLSHKYICLKDENGDTTYKRFSEIENVALRRELFDLAREWGNLSLVSGSATEASNRPSGASKPLWNSEKEWIKGHKSMTLKTFENNYLHCWAEKAKKDLSDDTVKNPALKKLRATETFVRKLRGKLYQHKNAREMKIQNLNNNPSNIAEKQKLRKEIRRLEEIHNSLEDNTLDRKAVFWNVLYGKDTLDGLTDQEQLTLAKESANTMAEHLSQSIGLIDPNEQNACQTYAMDVGDLLIHNPIVYGQVVAERNGPQKGTCIEQLIIHSMVHLNVREEKKEKANNDTLLCLNLPEDTEQEDFKNDLLDCLKDAKTEALSKFAENP